MLSTADGNVNLQQVGSECFTQGELVDACATLQLITDGSKKEMNFVIFVALVGVIVAPPLVWPLSCTWVQLKGA